MKKLLQQFMSCTLLLGSLLNVGYAQSNKPTWAEDINIDPNSAKVFSDLRIAVAFNGDVYVSRLVADNATSKPSYCEIFQSTDEGETFTLFKVVSAGSTIMTTADICAAGETNTNFRLYVACASLDTITNKAIITAHAYKSNGDGNELSFSGENYTSVGSTPSDGFVSMAWATDSRCPASLSSPYTISLAATKWSSPRDSMVVWWRTGNPSASFTRKAYAADASRYLRKISASMGNISMDGSILSPLLAIAYESQNQSGSNSNIQLKYIDGYNPTTIIDALEFGTETSKFYAPSIALSQTYGKTGTGTGYDDLRSILTYTSVGSSSSNIYFRISDIFYNGVTTFLNAQNIAATADEEMNAHVIFDPAYNNFLLTYYNQTTGKLPYIIKGIGSPANESFANISNNYRDATTKPASIEPRVDMSISKSKAAFVWNDNGKSMFDAEYATNGSTGINDISIDNSIQIYPNPAQNILHIKTEKAISTIRIYNAIGQMVLVANSIKNGVVDLSKLANGNYVILFEMDDGVVQSAKISKN